MRWNTLYYSLKENRKIALFILVIFPKGPSEDYEEFLEYKVCVKEECQLSSQATKYYKQHME